MCMATNFWIVDTFSDMSFHGVPSSVFFVDDLSDESLHRNIAMEINAPESIFLHDLNNGIFESVCYTPTTKGLFFGNSLFAAAKIIHEKTNLKQFSITCGIRVFAVEIVEDSKIEVRFSTVDLEKASVPVSLSTALNGEFVVSLAECKGELVVEIRSPNRLQNLQTNMDILRSIGYDSFAITADTHYETDMDYDFCLKVLAPKIGLYRAIATPIACTKLASYWADRMNKSEFIASGMGGEKLYIKHGREFTYISGHCTVSTEGNLSARI